MPPLCHYRLAGMQPRCRDATSIRLMFLAEGDGAPKSANLWVSAILLGSRRAHLGAPHALK
jgi:hypothetical protein